MPFDRAGNCRRIGTATACFSVCNSVFLSCSSASSPSSNPSAIPLPHPLCLTLMPVPSRPAPKRPPQLSLGRFPTPSTTASNGLRGVPGISIDLASAGEEGVDEDGVLTLSSPSSGTPSPIHPVLSSHDTRTTGKAVLPQTNANTSTATTSEAVGDEDELSKDLAVLAQLRKSVRKNLQLRPIKSSPSLRKTSSSSSTSSSSKAVFGLEVVGASPTWREEDEDEYGVYGKEYEDSPGTASSAATMYFTPAQDPRSAPLNFASGYPSSSSTSASALPSSGLGYGYPSTSSTSTSNSPRPSSSLRSFTSPAPSTSAFTTSASTSSHEREQEKHEPLGITPSTLHTHLTSSSRPLLLDTRPLPAYLHSHIRGSVNVAIPSLILKRLLKHGGENKEGGDGRKGVLGGLEGLRAFVTTDRGKREFDALISEEGESEWDGDVVVYDEEMDERTRFSGSGSNPGTPGLAPLSAGRERGRAGGGSGPSQAWILLDVLAPILSYGKAEFLKGGVKAAKGEHFLRGWWVSESGSGVDFGQGEEGYGDYSGVSPPLASNFSGGSGGGGSGGPGGLFQLDTIAARNAKQLPVIDLTSSPSASPPPPISKFQTFPRSSRSASSPSSSFPHDAHAQTQVQNQKKSPKPLMSSLLSSHSYYSPVQDTFSADSPTADSPGPKPDYQSTPSPPPSSIAFRRPAPPLRRPSAPSLRLGRLDTKSVERLPSSLHLNLNSPAGAPVPRLQLRTSRSATLAVPPSAIEPPKSPGHLNLVHSNHRDIALPSARLDGKFDLGMGGGRSPAHVHAHPQQSWLREEIEIPGTPSTPQASFTHHVLAPRTPLTARPEMLNLDPPPSTETETETHDPLSFTISTILPAFLFLGPEPSTEEHVRMLLEVGVRRIVNVATECGPDDFGLGLDKKGKKEGGDGKFEKYVKLGMRDDVEEGRVRGVVEGVCEVLGALFLCSLGESSSFVANRALASR